MKIETLNEAANKANGYNIYAKETKAPIFNEGFIEGAKWQEQKTIEEVFEWLTSNNYLTDLKETMIKDFNVFKNK